MKTKILAVALLTGLSYGQAGAQTVDFFNAASFGSSNQYYTESASVAGGLGNVIVTNGGGNAANAFDPTGRNDDGFSGPITLNFTTPFSFFGNSYSTFFANNNGNITFGGGNLNYTPDEIFPGGAALPVISPFFADVDTRNTSSGVMRLNQTVTNQTIVTWDSVGYYGGDITGLRNSFQLVLRGADYTVPSGEGQIGFFWKTMEWTTGDKSGGLGGFALPGGVPATVGFGDGLGSGLMLDVMDNSVAATVQDHYVWFNVGAQGVPVVATASPPPPPVPEPETYAMLLAGLGLLGFTARRRKRHNA